LENFRNCFKYEGVGPFYCLVEFKMIYRREGDFGANLIGEILEHVIIKLLGDVSGDAIMADDVLPKKFLMVAELIFVTGFTSTHFVKYSTTTMAKV
jgi:hypothetical protein